MDTGAVIESTVQKFHHEAELIFKEMAPQARQIAGELTKSAAGPDCALRFRDMGRTAGRAGSTRSGFQITLNPQLINHPEELRPTIAHEWAHVVVLFIKARLGVRSRRGQWAPHGAVWKAVAHRLGDNGDRCHSLALKPARKVRRRFIYESSEGTRCELTAVRHNRIQARRATYLCRKGGHVGPDQFLGEMKSEPDSGGN